MTRNPHSAFTLVELLASIAIIAVLVTAASFFTVSYVQWSKSIADQRTLTVLNDALTRYKCEGGNVNTLTLGAPIGHIISRLQTPVNWAGNGGHQFLQLGVTYPARSLSSTGTYAQYHFYQYNSYKAETLSASTPTNTYPYGQGVGYIAVNDGNGISLDVNSTTGYYAMQVSGSAPVVYANGDWPAGIPGSSATFWSCPGFGDSTPSGTIIGIDANECDGPGNCYNNVSALDVSGLIGIQSINCSNNQLTSLNVNGLMNLQSLECSSNQLTSLNVSGLTNLHILECSGNSLTSLNVSGLTNLHILECSGNSLTSLNVSGLTNLQGLYCGSNPLTSLNFSGLTQLQSLQCYYTLLTSLNVSGLTQLQTLYCFNSPLTSLNVSGLTQLQQLFCNNSQLGAITTTGCTSLPAPSINNSTSFRIQVNPSVTVTGPHPWP